MNEDLINSAVSFLKDPNVASSPITKKIEFLESKGLNQQEIEEALKRIEGRATASPSESQPISQLNAYSGTKAVPPIDYYNLNPPQLPERSWKDYLIMATATAGVSYGLYQVVTKYLIPSVIPPSQSSLEQDKAKIDEEFIKIDKILEQLAEDQEEIKKANETKLKDIDTVIDNVNDFLSRYNKDKLKFDDDLRLMKLEVDKLQYSIEKNMDSTKGSIKDELQEISEELVSLKQLVKIKTSSDSTPSRKITPASSIPSASEILKKAKVKSESSPYSPPISTESKSNVSTSEILNHDPTPVTDTSNSVYAAGIPQWQLQHKQEEESKNQERLKDSSDEKSSIPSWQQADSIENSDEIVQETIKRVGVPSWQLNASANESA